MASRPSIPRSSSQPSARQDRLAALSLSPTGSPRRLQSWHELSSRRPLPLRFMLLPSKRPNKTLCPALAVTFSGHLILRILDPEHHEPFVGVSPMFALAGLTPVEGLLRYNLRRDKMDYDLTLAGLEPWDDIWTPLAGARRIAEELDMLDQLGPLLSWSNRHIWTLDEGEPGLVHNWRVPATFLDPGSYSTGSLLTTSIPHVEALPRGQQVRTLVSAAQRQGAIDAQYEVYTEAEIRSSQQLIRMSVRSNEALNMAKAAAEKEGAPEVQDRSDQPGLFGTLSSRDLPVLLGVLTDLTSASASLPHSGLDLCNGMLVLSSRELARASSGGPGVNGSEDRAERVYLGVIRAKLNLALPHLLGLLALRKHEFDGTNLAVRAPSPAEPDKAQRRTGSSSSRPEVSSPVSPDETGRAPRKRRGTNASSTEDAASGEARLARVEASVQRLESGIASVLNLLQPDSRTPNVQTPPASESASPNEPNLLGLVTNPMDIKLPESSKAKPAKPVSPTRAAIQLAAIPPPTTISLDRLYVVLGIVCVLIVFSAK